MRRGVLKEEKQTFCGQPLRLYNLPSLAIFLAFLTLLAFLVLTILLLVVFGLSLFPVVLIVLLLL